MRATPGFSCLGALRSAEVFLAQELLGLPRDPGCTQHPSLVTRDAPAALIKIRSKMIQVCEVGLEESPALSGVAAGPHAEQAREDAG